MATPARKLNVIVYAGTGSTLESVRHCTYSLRRLLSPNYAVIPITESSLLKEPWAPTCALLVMPGGADLGYCRVLNGPGNRLITQYIHRGGAYLGFCAGGYYGTQRCEFEAGNPALEVIGKRELAFFPGTCRGGAFKGFEYHSERGAKASKLLVRKEVFTGDEALPETFQCYYNGGGAFVDAEKMATQGIEVLAEYGEDLAVESGETKAAVVHCKAGEGSVILTGPHPEFSATNLHRQEDIPGYDDLIAALAADEEARTTFLKACITKLGLEVSQASSSFVPSLSKLHLSALNSTDVAEFISSLEGIVTKEGSEEFVKGEHDLFHLEKPDSRWSIGDLNQALTDEYGPRSRRETRHGPLDPTADYTSLPKRIVSHEQAWPQPTETPYFDHSVFYSSLREYRRTEKGAEEWGNILMYGEVVTSTNTLLDRNPRFLSKLSTGFTLAATTQVAGRGRGSNVWVSPAGSLIMSTVINHPAHLASTHPVVFIQYLAAIAIVEAIHTYGHDLRYASLPIKLKWPNDIYAQDPTAPADQRPPPYVKIGGILSNCAYSAGSYQVVLGIGINTNNGRPTTSLDALLQSPANSHDSSTAQRSMPPFRVERLIARILTRLEALYGEFCRTGFSSDLERRYYAYWLHTGQLVTLEAEGGVRARILGITRDWGLLRAEEVRAQDLAPTGRTWTLQSDENSFDFWKGLLRRNA